MQKVILSRRLEMLHKRYRRICPAFLGLEANMPYSFIPKDAYNIKNTRVIVKHVTHLSKFEAYAFWLKYDMAFARRSYNNLAVVLSTF